MDGNGSHLLEATLAMDLAERDQDRLAGTSGVDAVHVIRPENSPSVSEKEVQIIWKCLCPGYQ